MIWRVVYTSSSGLQPQHDIYGLILGGEATGEVGYEGRPFLLLALRKRCFDPLHVRYAMVREARRKSMVLDRMLEKSFLSSHRCLDCGSLTESLFSLH